MSALCPIFDPIVDALLPVPWLKGGRDYSGTDCVGLVLLYGRARGLAMPDVDTPERRSPAPAEAAALLRPVPASLRDCPEHAILFRDKSGRLMHVGVVTPGGKVLHCCYGGTRVEVSLKLLARVGLRAAGVVPLSNFAALSVVLATATLGEIGTIILIVIAVISLAASVFLRPSLPKQGSTRGRYGFDALVTQNTPEVPLADVLGQVMLAGNSVYQTLMDKAQSVTDPKLQKACKIVVFCAGPIDGFGLGEYELRINGLSADNNYFFAPVTTPGDGFAINPAQTKAEAVTGTISGESNRPSITLYDAAPAITVPVDVRAQYFREFPVWGLNGCAYAVFRLVDSQKYSSFNVITRIKGRYCRTYTEDGLDVTTVTSESLTGADGSKVRFKLAHHDVVAVSSLTVAGVSQTEMSASNQTGAVYALNRTKGYVEFVTAPASGATVTISYTYYPRAWTANPADHIAYLLTETMRGKGFDGSRLDWPSFADARSYFAESVETLTDTGPITSARYTTNYALDARKPIQDHVKALLDSSRSLLLISDGLLKLKPVRTTASVFSFTTANIVADTFEATLMDRSDRANRVRVMFHDADIFNSEGEVVADDVADQADRVDRAGNDGVVDEALKFPAVTDRAMATRLAQDLLAESVGLDWTGQLTTTLIGLALEPGDIVDITHPSQPTWSAKLVRIDDLSTDADGRMVVRWSEVA